MRSSVRKKFIVAKNLSGISGKLIVHKYLHMSKNTKEGGRSMELIQEKRDYEFYEDECFFNSCGCEADGCPYTD